LGQLDVTFSPRQANQEDWISHHYIVLLDFADFTNEEVGDFFFVDVLEVAMSRMLPLFSITLVSHSFTQLTGFG
jgi:hypothetical protein